MLEFSDLGIWIGGGVTVVGLIQWMKGMAPKVPAWAWSAAAPVLAIAWAFAPAWARQAAGVLAISQVGYETIIQGLKRRLGGDVGKTP